MTERMTDEQLAEIRRQCELFDDYLATEVTEHVDAPMASHMNCKRLLSMLEAEREKVEELEATIQRVRDIKPFHTNMPVGGTVAMVSYRSLQQSLDHKAGE